MGKIIPTNGITTTMVGKTIGSSSRDVGTLCSHLSINMWAKYKPVRYNSVTGLHRTTLEMLEYGLAPNGTNVPSEPSFSVTSPHFTYKKPRGYNGVNYFEPYRLGDFLNPDSTVDGTDKTLAGYNHAAECFIRDNSVGNTLSFDKLFELQSSSTGNTSAGKLYMNKILNTGPNVEITADFLNSAITWESYVGIFFYNTRTKEKWYSAYKVRWSQLATSNLSWADFFPSNVTSSIVGGGREWPEHFYWTADVMDINNGDEIHCYYCCVPLNFFAGLPQAPQWRPDADKPKYWENMFNDNQVLYFVTDNLMGIQVVAPTPTNGHGVIKVSKFDFRNSNQLRLYNKQPPSALIERSLDFKIERNSSGTVSCSSVSVPISVYYFSELGGYNTSSANPEINAEMRVWYGGVDLLKDSSTRHFSSNTKEVSGTTPADGSANFYIKSSYNAIKKTAPSNNNEAITVNFEFIVRNNLVSGGAPVTPIRRTLVSGSCVISTGGVKTWYFNQV